MRIARAVSLEQIGHHLGGQRRKADDLAARHDGGELTVHARADENEQRARRGLFQCFEETVRRGVVEVVGVVEDGDFAASARRLQAEAATQLAHDLDRDFVAFFGAPDGEQVGMGAGVDQSAGDALVAGFEATRGRRFA